MHRITVLAGELTVGSWQVSPRNNASLLKAHPQKYRVCLGKRDTKTQRPAGTFNGITVHVHIRLAIALVHVDGSGYTVFGEVRVGVAENQYPVVFAGVDLNTQGLA